MTCISFPEPPRQASHHSTEGWGAPPASRSSAGPSRLRGCSTHRGYVCACLRFTLFPHMQSVGTCWKLHPARDYAEVLNRPSWHLLSDTRTPCLLRRKLRARWEVPGAAFLQTSLRSCVWGSPVNCQTSSYSESIILAVLWNDMFSRGDHTWSLSWSHMATKAVLEDALFTSTILWAFYCQETGMRSTGGGKQSVYIREKHLWACQKHKPFMPVVLALLWFLFISSWLYWNPTPAHSAREHLLTKRELMKTPGNTASSLSSFFKSFRKGRGLVLI